MVDSDEECGSISKEELVEYIFRKYGFSRDICEEVVRLYYKTSVVVKIDNRIVGVAFYIMISDEAINKLRTGEYSLIYPEIFEEIKRMTGQNMHVFGYACEPRIKFKDYLTSVVKKLKPASISWMTRKNNKLMRIKLCHH